MQKLLESGKNKAQKVFNFNFDKGVNEVMHVQRLTDNKRFITCVRTSAECQVPGTAVPSHVGSNCKHTGTRQNTVRRGRWSGPLGVWQARNLNLSLIHIDAADD